MKRTAKRFLLIAALACSLTAVPVQAEEICTFPAPQDISIEKELLITDLSVVNDARASGADGAVVVRRSDDGARAGDDAPSLVKHWLGSFEPRQEVNGFPLPPRPAMRARLVEPWMKKDGAHVVRRLDAEPCQRAVPPAGDRLSSRPRHRRSDGTIKSAGEARFVFTALDLGKTRRSRRRAAAAVHGHLRVWPWRLPTATA